MLPQQITGTSDVLLSMRPGRKLGRCAVVLRQGGREIQRHPLRKALPAEMIQFTLRHEHIIGNEEIEVSLE